MKKWIVGSIIFLFLIVGCSAVRYDVFVTIPSDSAPSDSTLASDQKQIKKHKPQAKKSAPSTIFVTVPPPPPPKYIIEVNINGSGLWGWGQPWFPNYGYGYAPGSWQPGHIARVCEYRPEGLVCYDKWITGPYYSPYPY